MGNKGKATAGPPQGPGLTLTLVTVPRADRHSHGDKGWGPGLTLTSATATRADIDLGRSDTGLMPVLAAVTRADNDLGHGDQFRANTGSGCSY